MVSGTLMVVVLLMMAFAGREKRLFQLAVVVGLLTAATVICEQLIVTDREAVEETVFRLATMVQSNDVEGVVNSISKTQDTTRQRARSEMNRYDFDTCRVAGTTHFDSREDGGVKTAEITFTVTVSVRGYSGPETVYGQRRVTLVFEKESDGQWRVINYSHEDPRVGVGL